MTDEHEWIEEDGLRWEGTREELEAWKRYKKTKAIAFVERGYSVEWYPDGENWMGIYMPERHYARAAETRAEVKFYGHPSSYGIDGGMVSKLSITSTTTHAIRQLLEGRGSLTRMLYDYDRGLSVNRLEASPEGQRLYNAILEELN